VSAEEFARQRAVNIALSGRYSLANWYDPNGNRREFACRTSRVSPFRMMVDVPVVGKVGDRVVSYFRDFGKLDGWITDTVKGGFLLELEVDRSRRERLANKLTWFEKKQLDETVKEARSQERIIPVNPHSTLVFADGTYRACFVIDMSRSGAAVSADVQPEIGTPLAVGACVGRVVRHLREGFAVKFVDLQDPLSLENLVARPVIKRKSGVTLHPHTPPDTPSEPIDPANIVFV
jgi:PilZ domain